MKKAMMRFDTFRAIWQQVEAVGLRTMMCCHTFRTIGIMACLKKGGTIENAQVIAAHESPRTTKLYDRRSDDINLDEIERIVI